MKTLLIATDFSANAQYAAAYGYGLAQQLKARMLLCHAMNVPAEIPQTGMTAWPMEVYDDLIQDSNDELAKLKCRLIAEGATTGYLPEIVCVHEAGFVTDVVNLEAAQHQADLIIIGAHGNDTLGTWMIGNHRRKLIESTVKPLLMIPAGLTFKPIKRVAFGSDFKQPDKDINAINELVVFAKALNAELILTHVDQSKTDPEYDDTVKDLLIKLISKLDHQKVTYKVVKSSQVESGLEWLIRHAHIDMMAVAHREHNFFDQLINGSHTQKASGLIDVPLLVFKTQETN